MAIIAQAAWAYHVMPNNHSDASTSDIVAGLNNYRTTAEEGEDIVEITPDQVGPATLGQRVMLRQVLNFTGTISNLDGESCTGYVTSYPYLPAILCWSYDIVGVVEKHDGDNWVVGDQTAEYLLRLEDVTSMHYGKNDTADIKRISALYKLLDGRIGNYFFLTGHFTKPLIAVYQNGYYLYVRDNYGETGLIYGRVAGSFSNGDMILDAKAKPSLNEDVFTIALVSPSSFTRSGRQSAVLPTELSINDVNLDMIHNYVRFNRVELTPTDALGDMSITDGTSTLPLVNIFNIEATEAGDNRTLQDVNGDGEVNITDVNALIDMVLNPSQRPTTTTDDSERYYDVTGFINKTNDTPVLYPVEISHHTLRGDLNGDQEVNIADVSCIIDFILNL